jgi:formylglycine-generating enzyme required for sulfatase activity
LAILVCAGYAYGIGIGTTGGIKERGKKHVAETNAAERITVPSTPSGVTSGVPGTSYTYSTGGSTSNLGHTVEYRFNWGAGAYSTWSTGTSASHLWSAAGTYSVSAEARCQTDTTITAVSSALSVGVSAPLGVGGTVGDMVLITAGTFNMGDPSYATPVHSVYLNAYYIDKYEVTFDQYDAFCTATSRAAASDSGFGRGTRPVINITWYDAKAYCEWAVKRLPTEAEWEGACRAGTDTAFYWGDDPGYTLMGNYAWNYNNSSSGTQPVGGKLANAFGLYDMSGNVWEWAADWYDGSYYSVSPTNNPSGPASGTYKVLRGGSWYSGNGDLRSGTRDISTPAGGNYFIGCRCARTP